MHTTLHVCVQLIFHKINGIHQLATHLCVSVIIINIIVLLIDTCVR